METISYLPILTEWSQHHNSCTLPVIDHLPEVTHSGVQWILGNDVCLLVLVALEGRGIVHGDRYSGYGQSNKKGTFRRKHKVIYIAHAFLRKLNISL